MHIREGRRGGAWKNLRGMVQPSQQHVAPYVKEVEWGLDMRGLRMMAAFWEVLSIFLEVP